MIPFGIRGSWGAMPDAAALAELGLTDGWVSAFVYSFDQLDEALARLDPRTRVHTALNNEWAEVGHDWKGWLDACTAFGERFAGRVQVVTAGVELDLWHTQPPVGEPDPQLTPTFAAALANQAGTVLRPKGIRVAPTSLASSGWTEYLRAMVPLCWHKTDLVDLHLYGKRIGGWPAHHAGWQEAREALEQARQISGKPVFSSEAGIKIDDAGGVASQAEWGARLLRLAGELDREQFGPLILFAWHDGVGTDREQGGQAFGMVSPHGRMKPLYYAIREAARALPAQPPHPTPPITEVRMTLEDLERQRWQLLIPDLPYHPSWGIPTYWREHPELGSPIGPEVTLADGSQAQPFVNGTVVWSQAEGARLAA